MYIYTIYTCVYIYIYIYIIHILFDHLAVCITMIIAVLIYSIAFNSTLIL